ncbi:MAG: divalent-cation tolerance protein CutA [Planctomycetota bacterium]
MSERCVTVYVTVPDASSAEALGRTVVDERLAACANVLPGLVSLYHWEGAVQREQEVALFLKTREALFDRLAARVSELHAYDVPCIVAWPIARGSPGYLDWVRAQTLSD